MYSAGNGTKVGCGIKSESSKERRRRISAVFRRVNRLAGYALSFWGCPASRKRPARQVVAEGALASKPALLSSSAGLMGYLL